MPKGIVGAGNPFSKSKQQSLGVTVPISSHLQQLAALAGVSPETFVSDAVAVYSKLLKERVQGSEFFMDETPYKISSLERAVRSLNENP